MSDQKQHQQAANYILSLLQNNCTIPGNAAENFVASKQWLMAIATGTLQVEQAGQPADIPPVTPEDQAEAA